MALAPAPHSARASAFTRIDFMRLGIITLTALLAGCFAPQTANIQLRKEKQALEDHVEMLKKERLADRATISALEKRSTTVPTLAQARIDLLFTTHSIKIGRLTGGAATAPDAAFDDAIKVYLTPLDETGSAIKATG